MTSPASLKFYLFCSSCSYGCTVQINNAAILIEKPTVEVTAEEFSSIMVINLESVYNLSQLAYPLLKASGAASIVFISSVAGVVAVKNLSV